MPNSNLDRLQAFFSEKLQTHGPSPLGVDWKTAERQELCFRQLLRICENPKTGMVSTNFSILDYGCGYGALANYLKRRDYECSSYTGYDIVPEMVGEARRQASEVKNCQFTFDESSLKAADYAVASGLLSSKLDLSIEEWEKHIFGLLHRLNALGKAGFSFNSLTKYSDRDRMRPDLYYGDPAVLFDYCKTMFSKNVAILHDYGAYEFTVLVRKDL